MVLLNGVSARNSACFGALLQAAKRRTAPNEASSGGLVIVVSGRRIAALVPPRFVGPRRHFYWCCAQRLKDRRGPATSQPTDTSPHAPQAQMTEFSGRIFLA